MHQRLWHIIFIGLLLQPAIGQSQRIPLLQPGDTLYKSIDLLPEAILSSPNSESGFWDFSSLLAPYVHEVYVRSVSPAHQRQFSADLVMMDADGTERFAAVSEGGISLAGFRATLDGKHAYLGVCNPAIPWRTTSAALGDKNSYAGICSFSVPEEWHKSFGITNAWAADSLRVVVEYLVTAEIDARGAMVTPGGQFTVIRERKVIDARPAIEQKKDGMWTTLEVPKTLQLPIELQSGTIYTFWSTALPEPVAVAQSDATGNIKRVEFKANPYGGRLVSTFPRVADVFVYPNPSFGEVRFDFVNLEPGEYTLEIYNILGVIQRTLGPLQIDGNRTIPLDLSDLKKGTYIYRLVDKNKTALRSKRLVIITP